MTRDEALADAPEGSPAGGGVSAVSGHATVIRVRSNYRFSEGRQFQIDRTEQAPQR